MQFYVCSTIEEKNAEQRYSNNSNKYVKGSPRKVEASLPFFLRSLIHLL